MRPNILPGLALAGGVVAAAVIALLLLGGAGGSRDGGLPNATSPGAVRLFPGPTRPAPPRHRRHGGRGSAAESQYGAGGDRGTVLGTAR